MPDKADSGLGGDADRQWSLASQWDATHAFTVRVCGSEDAALEEQRLCLPRFANPTVYFHCTLFDAEGRVAS